MPGDGSGRGEKAGATLPFLARRSMIERIGLFEAAILASVLPLSTWALHWVLGDRFFGAHSGGLWIPTACFAVGYYYNQLYDSRLIGTPSENAAVIRTLASTGFLLALFYLVAPSLRPHESYFASVGLVSTATGAVALGIRHAIRDLMQTARLRHRVLVLGTNAWAYRIARELCVKRHLLQQNVRLVREGPVEEVDGAPSPFPIAGHLVDLDAIVDEFQPSTIVVSLAERRNRLPMRQLLRCRIRGIRIENGIHTYEGVTGKLAIESLSPSDLLFSDRLSIPLGKIVLSRVVSIAFALVGLILTAPLMAVIAVIVKATSPGPALFVQDRVGLRGRSFRLYKFRTMTVATSTTSEWEADNVARITPIGHWLRRFRLDELPQFWNILRGDMNLIGPRPHPVSNHRLFEAEIPYYELRSTIRPGLTGWAQIHSGYANDLAGEIEKMRYDLFYIANPSLWLDIHILLTTLRVLLFRTDLERSQEVVAASASTPHAS